MKRNKFTKYIHQNNLRDHKVKKILLLEPLSFEIK